MRRPPVRRTRLLAAAMLALPLLAAGCTSDEPAPPQSFAPLHYEYLRPLRLNVGSVQIEDALPPPAGPDLSAQSPASPAGALQQMARDRLVATGAAGHATFTVQQASITPRGDQLDGLMRVRVDIYASDGHRAAFAEAAVARSSSGPEQTEMMPAALYDLTRQMMSDMNVELEFQLRRSLGDWLQSGAGPAPAPVAVQQEALPPPNAPAAGASGGAGAPARQPSGYRLVPLTPGATQPPG